MVRTHLRPTATDFRRLAAGYDRLARRFQGAACGQDGLLLVQHTLQTSRERCGRLLCHAADLGAQLPWSSVASALHGLQPNWSTKNSLADERRRNTPFGESPDSYYDLCWVGVVLHLTREHAEHFQSGAAEFVMPRMSYSGIPGLWKLHAEVHADVCLFVADSLRDEGSRARDATGAGRQPPFQDDHEPLPDKVPIAWRILMELPEHKALTAPQLLEALRECGIYFSSPETLRANLIPELKKLGVKNKRRIGYYIPQSARRPLS